MYEDYFLEAQYEERYESPADEAEHWGLVEDEDEAEEDDTEEL